MNGCYRDPIQKANEAEPPAYISGAGRSGRLQCGIQRCSAYLDSCSGLADVQPVGDVFAGLLQLIGGRHPPPPPPSGPPPPAAKLPRPPPVLRPGTRVAGPRPLPASLSLPPGAYRARLAHPESGCALTVTFDVRPGGTTRVLESCLGGE